MPIRVLKTHEDYNPREMKGEPALRAVYQGDSVQCACEGGFVRRQAPEAGIVVENESTAIYVPWAELDELRAVVQRRPAGSAPAGIRVRPVADSVVAPKRGRR